MKDKRRFQRIVFEHDATLSVGDQQWSIHLLDLCLKGILCTEPDGFPADTDLPIHFSLVLDDTHKVQMEMALSHRNDGHLGMECRHIDIDSISELKKIVQLNLGDDQLLYRELEQLAVVDKAD